MLFLRTLVAITVVALWAPGSDARPATVSDFAICDYEAATSTGGSAMPRAADPLKPAPPVAAKTEGGMSTGTDPSGKLIVGSSDVLSEGMDATRADDPGYRTAYRHCMAQRGITARPAP